VSRGNPADDWKSPAGEITVECRRILGLTQAGNTTEAFLADTLAPLIRSEMQVYEDIKKDIFG
jgi:hypothetical protein